MKVALATVTAVLTFLVSSVAAAHTMKINAPTPGGKIIVLENRAYHDQLVIKRRGNWKKIGQGWMQYVKFQINRYEVYEHRKDLKVVSRLLTHYRSLIGSERAWNCIHSHEGSWTDPNPPYYGGLQMDLGFQRRYGYWLYTHIGTADRWNRYDQMIVAERARRSGRGYYPWPNTARMCGLI